MDLSLCIDSSDSTSLMREVKVGEGGEGANFPGEVECDECDDHNIDEKTGDNEADEGNGTNGAKDVVEKGDSDTVDHVWAGAGAARGGVVEGVGVGSAVGREV